MELTCFRKLFHGYYLWFGMSGLVELDWFLLFFYMNHRLPLWVHFRPPLTFRHRELHQRLDSSVAIRTREMISMSLSFLGGQEKGHMERQRDKTLFSVVNTFYSHSLWAVVSMLWQTNCHLFVPPSLCNCTPASFSHRPDLSWFQANATLYMSLTRSPDVARSLSSVTVAVHCGVLPQFLHT